MSDNAIIVDLLFILFYLVPLLVAMGRKHNNRLAIGALTVFFGWTMIGWIVAFIWSLTMNTEENTQKEN